MPLAALELVSTDPSPVPAGGTATVRLRLHGGPDGAAAYLSIQPAEAVVPRLQGYTAAVREAHLEGAGGRVFSPTALPPVAVPTSGPAASRAVPDEACRRGRYVPIAGNRPVSYFRSIQVDASATVDVVATIEVPVGLAGVPASLTVRAQQIYLPDETRIDLPLPVPLEPGEASAVQARIAATTLTVPLPRSGPTHDLVTLMPGSRSRNGERMRLRGVVVPPRAGAVVQIAGRRTPNRSYRGEVLGREEIATAPIGPRMRYFGEAKTDDDGRWATWVTLPPRVAVVARTTEVPGVTLGGASCGLWFSSPTLDQRALDAKRKASAKRRREAEKRNGDPR